MIRRFALSALVLAALLPASLSLAAPKKPRAPPLPPPPPVDTAPVQVAINTAAGAIVVEVDPVKAPITARNFLAYVDGRRFDGIAFYRAMHLAWGQQPNGLIQTGTRGDPARTLKPIAHEPTTQTGLLHKAGALSMARWAPGTAAGDFSILLSDMPGLDTDPKAPESEAGAGYAVFGHVVSGMETVRAIWDSPRSPTEGVGVMKGQMLAPTVRVLTVRRVPVARSAPNPAPPMPAP